MFNLSAIETNTESLIWHNSLPFGDELRTLGLFHPKRPVVHTNGEIYLFHLWIGLSCLQPLSQHHYLRARNTQAFDSLWHNIWLGGQFYRKGSISVTMGSSIISWSMQSRDSQPQRIIEQSSKSTTGAPTQRKHSGRMYCHPSGIDVCIES